MKAADRSIQWARACMGLGLMIPPGLAVWSLRFDPVETAPQQVLLAALIGVTIIRLLWPVNLGIPMLALTTLFITRVEFSLLAPGPMVTVVATSAAVVFTAWSMGRRSLVAMAGLGLMALMGLGQASDRWPFGLAAALQLALTTMGLMLADPAMPPMERRGWRQHGVAFLAPILLAFTLSAPVMIGLGYGLPSLEPIITRWMSRLLSGERGGESGFKGGEAILGGLSGILNSDEIVMRIWPSESLFELPGLLRGQVYQRYSKGRWIPEAGLIDKYADAEGELVLGEGATRRRARVELTSTAASGFLYAPMEALRLEEVPRGTQVNHLGVIRSPDTRVWGVGRPYWLTEGRPPVSRKIGRPTPEDMKLPEEISGAFHALSRKWVPDDLPPAELIPGLLRHLLLYRYTLRLEPSPAGVDPLWHFLTDTKAGHCELFSSAFVALLRARGVPARWVTGFRVAELNHDGGYAVVRERDAHAWAEVYYEGRWHTFDPTPPSSEYLADREMAGAFSEAWDALKVWLNRVWNGLGAQDPSTLLIALGVISALAFLWLAIRRRRGRGRKRIEPVEGFAALDALTRWLAREGEALARPPHEPLSHYARRIEGEGWPEAAALVRRCVQVRYGQEGDAEALIADIEAFLGRQ